MRNEEFLQLATCNLQLITYRKRRKKAEPQLRLPQKICRLFQYPHGYAQAGVVGGVVDAEAARFVHVGEIAGGEIGAA